MPTNHTPGQMTQEEQAAQCGLVSEAARALDYFSEDELEQFAKERAEILSREK